MLQKLEDLFGQFGISDRLWLQFFDNDRLLYLLVVLVVGLLFDCPQNVDELFLFFLLLRLFLLTFAHLGLSYLLYTKSNMIVVVIIRDKGHYIIFINSSSNLADIGRFFCSEHPRSKFPSRHGALLRPIINISQQQFLIMSDSHRILCHSLLNTHIIGLSLKIAVLQIPKNPPNQSEQPIQQQQNNQNTYSISNPHIRPMFGRISLPYQNQP